PVADLKHQFFYVGEEPLTVRWEPEEQEYIEISMTTKYLRSVLPAPHCLHMPINTAMGAAHTDAIYASGVPIWPQLKPLLFELAYSRMDGLGKMMYIRSKIIELLAIVHAKYRHDAGYSNTQAVLPAHEKEKMLL